MIHLADVQKSRSFHTALRRKVMGFSVSWVT